MANGNFQITTVVQNDGMLLPHPRQTIRSILGSLTGETVSITVARAKKKRSLSQNKFYWGVVIPIVRGLFISHGDTVTDEFVHRYLKGEIGGYKKLVTLPDGSQQWDIDTSTKLSTKEWEDWMEKIRAWSAPFGLQIPFPNESREVGCVNSGAAI